MGINTHYCIHPHHQAILSKLYQKLNSNEILAYEDVDDHGRGLFSYPETTLLQDRTNILQEFCLKNVYQNNVGDSLFGIIKQLNLHNITLKINRAVLTTTEGKSLYRRELQNTRNTVYKDFSDQKFNDLINGFIKLEENDTILGFARNIIAIGQK